MTRFKLVVEYDGTGLVGWQRQDNGPSVQAFLEAAAGRLAGHPVEAVAAGRTDAGVHALGQVAHMDLAKELSADAVRDGLNFWLHDGGCFAVAVRSAETAPADFHARFSAVGRRYLYRILNRRAPPVLERDRVWWVPHPLDGEVMAGAAGLLVGRHDFSTFRAADCQAASPVKTLDEFAVTPAGDELRVSAYARSFLHHQVRNMVGSLKLVGEGRWSAADLAQALEARDRTKGGPTAPAGGLCLMEVAY